MKIGNIDLGKTPIILAPMEDITELPFRVLCKEMGADLMFSEFIASEGLIRNAQKSVIKLRINNGERPVGIQIFGGKIESLVKAAEIAMECNPDIIDLNCGCPVKKVVGKGGGAAMLQDPDKMIRAASEIVKISNVPVTVKTRIGWDSTSINILDIALRLQDVGISALTIHGRTRAQMYNGKADWNVISSVKSNSYIKIPIIGNGDINSEIVAKKRFDESHVDGIMIGRAAIGNPWIFKQIKSFLNDGIVLSPPTIHERVTTCRRHFEMSINYKEERRTVLEMRHHYAKYFQKIQNFKPYKLKLLSATSAKEIYSVFDEIDNSEK